MEEKKDEDVESGNSVTVDQPPPPPLPPLQQHNEMVDTATIAKTKLPKLKVFLLCCIILSDSFAITMLFPFVSRSRSLSQALYPLLL